MGGGGLSSQQAADRLGLSVPTVRKLLESGRLAGHRRERGSRFVWEIEPRSVDALAAERSSRPKRQTLGLRLQELAEEVAELRAAVTATDVGASGPQASDAALRAALLEQRAMAQALRDADEERAEMVRHLQAALAASERADEHRRRALQAADTLLGEVLMPRDASGL